MTALGRWGVVAAAWCLGLGVATAQERDVDPVQASVSSRVEVSVSGGVLTGGDLGATDATLTMAGTPTGAPGALFTADTRIGAAPMVEGRVGVRVTRRWRVEAGASLTRPDLAARLTGDMEGIPDTTAVAKTTQVLMDVGVQYRWAGRRVRPFAMAGGGYMRHLDDPRTTLETGPWWYGGGGLIVALAPGRGGLLGRLALRGDVRASWLRGGLVVNDDRPVALSATGGVSVRLR